MNVLLTLSVAGTTSRTVRCVCGSEATVAVATVAAANVASSLLSRPVSLARSLRSLHRERGRSVAVAARARGGRRLLGLLDGMPVGFK